MKRKRVAIFGNAWSYEFVQSIMQGVIKYSRDNDVDVDTFISYTSVGSAEDEIKGESNIYRLPKLRDYDGAIIMGNTINTQQEIDLVRERVLEAGINSVSLETKIDGINFIGTENYSGMYELAEHIFKYHGIEDVFYVSGPKDNLEAQERLKAVSDAAKKNNIPFGKENIYYGDWSYYCGSEMLEKCFPTNRGIPRVIMCANDSMAIGVCECLTNNGYKVPEDVIVTGFDALDSAINYYPSITTVARDWESMGYNAMEQVLNEQKDKSEKLKRKILKSKMSIGESCGCALDTVVSEKRLKAARTTAYQQAGNISFDIHMRDVYTHMRDIYTVEDLHNSLSKHYSSHRKGFEGANFYLCVDENFFIAADEPLTKEIGFSDKMVSCVNMYEKNIYPLAKVGEKDILPDFARDDHARVFNYKSLYCNGRIIGYAAMEASLVQYEKYSLYVWSRHMYQNFDQIEKNNQMKRLTDELKKLSNTDSLTELYNRTGCDNIAVPFFGECISLGKNVGIIMCDVDDMKIINDEYGHLQGDLALRTLANAIKVSIDDKWYPCRYGGDEFILIGECEDEDELNRIINSISDNIVVCAKETHLQYELKVSVGGVVIDSEDEVSFEIAMKIADDRMYSVKSKHKSTTGGVIR